VRIVLLRDLAVEAILQFMGSFVVVLVFVSVGAI
jgi:hypothetical protein